MIQSPWIHDVTATVEPVDPPTPSEPGGHSGHGAPDLDAGGDLPSIPAMFLDWSWATGPLAIGVVMIAAYTLGVAVLRRRGDRWPWWRSASWLAGVLSLWSVTVTAIGGYGMAMFSAHMVQHMVVGMLTPILLLVGAPVTLGLRALPATPARRGAPRRLLLAVLHSRAAAVVTSPVVTVGLFIASLYALYFTPMLDLAMGTGLGHTLMLVHFVAVGLLFFGPVLAVDPWPRSPTNCAYCATSAWW